jgi:hypothetical protein
MLHAVLSNIGNARYQRQDSTYRHTKVESVVVFIWQRHVIFLCLSNYLFMIETIFNINQVHGLLHMLTVFCFIYSVFRVCVYIYIY